MIKTIFKSVVYLLLIHLFYSCSGKYPGFEQAENGVYRQVHYQGNDTTRPKETDWVTVKMNYRLEDSMLFKSTYLNEPLQFAMIPPMFQGDLYQALELMGTGDSMTFVIVADSFFYKTVMVDQLPPYVKPGSLMYYDVKLLEHITNEEYLAEIERKKQALRQKEQEILDQYILENEITIAPLESGLFFIQLNKSKGRTADTGEMCQVYMEVKLLDGTSLYSNFDKEPMDIEFGKDFDTKGLMEGLSMLPVGGKARLIVPSSIGVGETGKKPVEPFTTIIYDVQLIQLRSVEEVKIEREERRKAEELEKQQLKEAEPSRINKYISDNKIETMPEPSGLYYIPLREGSGEKVKPGDKIQVHYSLYSIDGLLIESTLPGKVPYEFELGKGQVIKGWEEAILKMKPGGKAKLIIPSGLGYGSAEMREKLKPYSPLVYEIEIVKID